MTLEINSVNISDKELVSRAQEGQVRAFEELVHRYDQRVLSIALSFARDPDDAKDIYQEAFLRAYRALRGFRHESEFSTWLYRIVTNVCLSYRTRRAGRTYADLDAIAEQDIDEAAGVHMSAASPPSPERVAQNAEIRDRIRRAVDALAPRERLAFTLKHFEGYKIREIAEMMDCNEGTAKRYLFTAAGKLRKKLKNLI